MATVGGGGGRSVRFSEDLAVAPPPSNDPEQYEPDDNSAFLSVNDSDEGDGDGRRDLPKFEPPNLYDDEMYAPYDIYTAASIGDTQIVESNLRSCFYPNSQNSSGWSALMYAAYLGHEPVCMLLLKNGANLNLSNQHKQTALMLAAACGNLAVVRVLMRKGAQVDKQDANGDTALAHATSCSQTSVVEALLEAEADPDLANNIGMTPTLTACSIGHELTLLTLLQHDGNPKLKNAKGEDGEALASDCPKALAILRDPPENKRRVRRQKSVAEVNSLAELLSRLKLDKYQEIFDAENIDLNLFLELTEADILELGIKAFGPRKKMMNVIQHYRKDGTILLYNDDTEAKPVAKRGHSSENSDQVTTELVECQQQLSIYQQKLTEIRAVMQTQQMDVNEVALLCEEARAIAHSMLDEIRQYNSEALKNNFELLIRNIDSIFIKLAEVSSPSYTFPK